MSEEDTSPFSPEDVQLYRYWTNCIKRAKKLQPLKSWDEVEKRLLCKEKAGKPYVNGYRLLYESLKSFLDQTEPTFKVSPTDAFINNQDNKKYKLRGTENTYVTKQEEIIQRAECEYQYLKYVWSEQNCQVAESMKLDSTLQRNIGFTMPYFDKKKWMPAIRYIPAKNCFFDPDCGGDISRAQWCGYEEDISLEGLKSSSPELSASDIEAIAKSSGSVLSKEEQDELVNNDNTEDGKLYRTVTKYHIFARNDAAVRILKRDSQEEKIPSKSVADELELTTPTRHLQFVRGYHKPLKDGPWPYELDHDEFPLTALRFNTPVESLYGFTDYTQMQAMDMGCDNIMKDIEESSYWAGRKKFGTGPGGEDLTEVTISDFLKNPEKTVMLNIIGPDGLPKIKEIQVGELNIALLEAYKVFDQQRKTASGLGELLSTEAREYKDVTALAARIHDANIHQRVNRRLGGPEGYESSIAEDAVKILEIAHQIVPRYSLVEIFVREEIEDEQGMIATTGNMVPKLISLSWQSVPDALAEGGCLIKLGIDAIVGPKLAQYWQTAEDGYSAPLWKLSTRVRVMPGSTRSVTKEHRAAMLKVYYNELFGPLYQTLGRWDLAIRFLADIGRLAGIENIDEKLPKLDEIKQFMTQMQQQQQLAATQGGEQNNEKAQAEKIPAEFEEAETFA